jgi:uncharacterized protein (DUF2267 family)
MDHERFLAIVEREAGVDRQEAERATRATLETLSVRLSEGLARSVAEKLPEELAQWIRPRGAREKLSAEEFLQRVAEREGTDVATAERHARAVFLALGRALTAPDFEDLTRELPKDFRPLLEEALRPPAPVVPIEEFLRRVADRAGVDTEAARRASEAVLETLAERLAGGEVDDLRKQLPTELHDALRRGKERTHGVARKMSLEQFLGAVAEREGVSVDEAREHARGLFLTLRDALTEKEYSDIWSELPRQYEVLAALP